MSQAISIFNRPRLDVDSPAPPALAVTGSLPDYVMAEAYSERLQIENSIGKCTVAVTASTLPDGALVYVDNFTKEVVVSWPGYDPVPTSELPNGGFEQGAVGWTLSGPWEINNTGDAETGVYSAEFKKGTAGSFNMVGTPVPVGDSTSITIDGRVQQGASSAGNAGAGVGLRWYGSGGATLSESFGTQVTSGSGGAWNTATHSATKPIGAAKVAALVRGFRLRENKPLWVDNVSWSHEYAAGDDSGATYSLSLEVTDSTGRVAAWSGTIAAEPLIGTLEDEILADAPWAYWQLQEASGPASFLDLSGNGRHLTVQSGVTAGTSGLVAGGTATEFSGSGSYICGAASAHGAAISSAFEGNKEFTLLTVARPTTLVAQSTFLHIGNLSTNGEQGVFLLARDDTFRLQLLINGLGFYTIDSPVATLAAGVTTMIHAIRRIDADSPTLAYGEIYANGANVTSGTPGIHGSIGAANSAESRLTLGALNASGSFSNNFGGKQQHVAIFASAIAPARCAAHHLASGL